MEKLHLSHRSCVIAAQHMAKHIASFHKTPVKVYPVPRGGVPVAYLLAGYLPCILLPTPEGAEIFVDDIVDSGATRARHPGKPFYALTQFIEHLPEPCPWVVFPWEYNGQGQEESAEDIVIRLLQYVGEDPNREGLKETPKRVLKAWKEWTEGYSVDPLSVFKVFGDGAENYDQMITQPDIQFYSHCEHHLAPFFGTATIAYVPNGNKVIGASKLSRILDIYAHRLQIQERLTTQVADAVEKLLQPKGVGVVIRARHLCMESRGIKKHGQHMQTCALRGVLRDDAKAREEFLFAANSK